MQASASEVQGRRKLGLSLLEDESLLGEHQRQQTPGLRESASMGEPGRALTAAHRTVSLIREATFWGSFRVADSTAVGFRTEAGSTHFRYGSFVLRALSTSSGSELRPEGRAYHLFIGWEHRAKGVE